MSSNALATTLNSYRPSSGSRDEIPRLADLIGGFDQPVERRNDPAGQQRGNDCDDQAPDDQGEQRDHVVEAAGCRLGKRHADPRIVDALDSDPQTGGDERFRLIGGQGPAAQRCTDRGRDYQGLDALKRRHDGKSGIVHLYCPNVLSTCSSALIVALTLPKMDSGPVSDLSIGLFFDQVTERREPNCFAFVSRSETGCEKISA